MNETTPNHVKQQKRYDYPNVNIMCNSCTKTGEFLPPQIEGFFAQGQVGDVREPGGWGFRPQLVKLWILGPHLCIPGLT